MLQATGVRDWSERAGAHFRRSFFFIDVVGVCWLLEEEDSLFGGGRAFEVRVCLTTVPLIQGL